MSEPTETLIVPRPLIERIKSHMLNRPTIIIDSWANTSGILLDQCLQEVEAKTETCKWKADRFINTSTFYPSCKVEGYLFPDICDDMPKEFKVCPFCTKPIEVIEE